MCPGINIPASCEILPLIRILYSKNMCVTEIHRELCAVYCQNKMSKEPARQWCRMFTDGRTNVHDEERSCRPSVVSDDLVHSVYQKVCGRWRFVISELTCGFQQISSNVHYEIITVTLGYDKFCARWILKVLTGEHNM
jgi:hypothetical protein